MSIIVIANGVMASDSRLFNLATGEVTYGQKIWRSSDNTAALGTVYTDPAHARQVIDRVYDSVFAGEPIPVQEYHQKHRTAIETFNTNINSDGKIVMADRHRIFVYLIGDDKVRLWSKSRFATNADLMLPLYHLNQDKHTAARVVDIAGRLASTVGGTCHTLNLKSLANPSRKRVNKEARDDNSGRG